ncbi:phosphocarrier protein HPr [Syntrophotalea carbinolica DSM 2380]|uniref:Phosphocarrier protein HPr n=1 Tax=Syntrophotalea carbinolica (strain DSM 2380 / NBRC 103641 / GraBd1) TaxID=338963 RepID=Q3A386_SYNC1|nr:HPr family phosphocarrier protein [Syntrophotalea carbinolica]ABA89171.2 phosphocarrier protein HPr [Syntrophotalea carbinolica DSM 2380]
MEKKRFTIINKLGLHARAAALFVQTASKFTSEVTVSKDGEEVSGKSIMGILMLAAAQGSHIELAISGQDAQHAMEALGELIDNGFGEL